jgi:hypothetical protein
LAHRYHKLTSGNNSSSVWIDDVGRIESGVEGSPFDVGVDNICARRVGLNIGWLARSDRTATTCNTWSGWVRVNWEWRIKPQHADRVVIPDGHYENTSLKGLTHDSKTSLLLVDVAVTESGLLGSTECVRDRVSGKTRPFGSWSGISFPTLDIVAFDLDEGAAGSSTICDELCDDGKWLGCVNGFAWAIEVLVARTVWVDIASIGIALGSVSVSNTAGSSATLLESNTIARMSAAIWLVKPIEKDKSQLTEYMR